MVVIMKLINTLKNLTGFELVLWIASVVIVTASYLIFSSNNYISLISSLIGVTALIFVAKGYIIGQVLTVVFSVFYGIVSFYFGYYGEMITYLGMTSPIAILTLFSWIKHPYKDTSQVEVKEMTLRQLFFMIISGIAVTIIFYYILKGLNTTNLFFSTISVTTSYFASFMTLMRSQYYGFGYAANDVVLIILWISAYIKDRVYITMVICFFMFLINDLYGFYNWRRMKKQQSDNNKSHLKL